MQKTPSELMKELKFIKAEIRELHNQDELDSTERVRYYDSKPTHLDYSYEDNRKAIQELREREMQIHNLLSIFNLTTKIPGFDLTVSEGLLRLAQLKEEGYTLDVLAGRRQIKQIDNYGDDKYEVCGYDVAKAKSDLKALQRERSNLQIAIDRVNLTSSIDC